MRKYWIYILLVGIIAIIVIGLFIFDPFNEYKVNLVMPKNNEATIKFSFEDGVNLQTISMYMNQEYNESHFTFLDSEYLYINYADYPLAVKASESDEYNVIKEVDGIDLSYNITDLYKLFYDLVKMQKLNNSNNITFDLSEDKVNLLKKYIQIMSFYTNDIGSNAGYSCTAGYNDQYILKVSCKQNDVERIAITFSNFDSDNVYRYKVLY